MWIGGTSFYADDAALFINPIAAEVKVVLELMDFFGQTSGLRLNLNKCTAYPVRCESLDLNEILLNFGGSIGSLPSVYLGVPLCYRKPRRVDCQPFIDKIVGK